MSAESPAVSSKRPEAAGSRRVSLARAALHAALQAPGVVGSDPGPDRLRVTADPPAGPLVGVSATAQADGRYAIDLSLVADMVPLPELAEQVRERVRKRTSGERLEELLGSINVDFAYVITAEELAAAAAAREAEEARGAEKLASADASAKQTQGSTVAASASERGSGDATAGQVSAGPARAGQRGVAGPSAEAPPAACETAALAVRQAALATDQAALAAKQAALAAEQAALVAGPGMTLPPHSRKHAAEEQER